MSERVKAPVQNLYITVEGEISFETPEDIVDFRVGSRVTKVGYFRKIEERRLEHVFGVHYDSDNEISAHPIYHSQLDSMRDLVSHINGAYGTEFHEIDTQDDHVKKSLKNVRIPTAQMDFFSVVTQICGDHLVSAEADRKYNLSTVAKFNNLKMIMNQIKGDAVHMPRLKDAWASNCLRSNHWYA